MDLNILVKARLDLLEKMMEENLHIQCVGDVEDLVESISKFWILLEEDEKEYIQAVRYAIENQKEWK